MSDLSEFLLARIAEDEHRLDLPDYDVVRNSHGEISARGEGWVTRGECPVCGAYQFDGTESVTKEAWWDHAETVHQRTRVLAECDAKRRIIRWVQQWPFRAEPPSSVDGLLPILALPYADHEQFQEEWRV